ncbi:XRE family transcriptional regulator [Psychrobacter glaciei]|uniref:XRE family transcriptional regulator n=1 Tax=Psychrobacter glaciei TaxID=619771 RepID=UPI001F06CDD7|nr:LexA family transcriptional regulator [Psychrobacter glaciei]MCH1781752.1 LexA family transcriptional regulator [Psychrobacter glaciei]
MALGSRVKEAREHRGLTQGELADKIGWSQQALSTLEKRDSKKSAYASPIAKALDIDIDWLMSGTGEMLIKPENKSPSKKPIKYVPVKGSAQMGDQGYWIELDYMGNGGDGYLEVNNASDDAYVIRAVGDSMFPALRSGWYIVFDPKRDPCAGEYVHIVLADGRNMIKEFVSCQHGVLTVISVNGMERMSFNCDDVKVLNPFVEIQPPSRLRDELHVLDNECAEN